MLSGLCTGSEDRFGVVEPPRTSSVGRAIAARQTHGLNNSRAVIDELEENGEGVARVPVVADEPEALRYQKRPCWPSDADVRLVRERMSGAFAFPRSLSFSFTR